MKYRSEEPPQYPADDDRGPEKEEFTVGMDDPEDQVGPLFGLFFGIQSTGNSGGGVIFAVLLVQGLK